MPWHTRRYPHRRRRECLVERRRWCPLLFGFRTFVGQDQDSRTSRQLDLRWTEKEPAIHYGYDFVVCGVCRDNRGTISVIQNTECGMRNTEFGSGDCPVSSWHADEPHHDSTAIRVPPSKTQSPPLVRENKSRRDLTKVAQYEVLG